MKNFAWVIMIFFACTAHAQITDNFGDGNFTDNPSWSGSTSQFIINTESQLQLNSTGAGTSWLSTPCAFSSLENRVWQTSVRQSFAPSGSNFGRIYLVSDQPDLTTPLHGYYLQLGEAGSSDAITLYRQDGSKSSVICKGKSGGIAASFNVRIQVTHKKGQWEISTDYTGGSNFASDAIGSDSTYRTSDFLGVYCSYTSSNASKFYFDDLYAGSPKKDPDPPIVTRPAVPKDIIITEVLADPEPAIRLPDTEYAEIYNRTSEPIDLSNWTISDGNSSGVFPALIINPGKYFVLTSATSAPLFGNDDSVVGLAGFPSLNNSGDVLILKDKAGVTIDSIHYTSAWYRDTDKQDGGWSLELIDPANPCGEEDNWAACEDSGGGTPGRQNSIFASKPDITGPRLLSVVPMEHNQLSLMFDEKLNRNSCTNGRFSIFPALEISKIHFADLSMRQILIDLEASLSSGQLYSLSVENISDCNGNAIQPEFHEITFALPETADSLDIVVNEILFNPRPLGVDFVEVYNNSAKYINLDQWKIANQEDGIIKNPVQIHGEGLLLAPHSFLCFTTDNTALKSNYPNSQEQHFFITPLPSFPDDAGSAALISKEGILIDWFSYDHNFHSPLIKDDEGVSLERISYSGKTNDAANWKSASSQSGFATPGYRNSNATDDLIPDKGKVEVSPVVFAPGSGTIDFAKIIYRFEMPGYTANLKIFDQEGRLIRTLGNNETLSSEGFFRWDGERDDGSRARIGYYIVWLDVFDLSGTVKTYRKRVIIAAR